VNRSIAALLLLFLAGCSTAPLADVLDLCKPGRIRQEGGATYGGVSAPPPVGVPPPPTVPP
jgi:hypothetical protein